MGTGMLESTQDATHHRAFDPFLIAQTQIFDPTHLIGSIAG